MGLMNRKATLEIAEDIIPDLIRIVSDAQQEEMANAKHAFASGNDEVAEKAITRAGKWSHLVQDIDEARVSLLS